MHNVKAKLRENEMPLKGMNIEQVEENEEKMPTRKWITTSSTPAAAAAPYLHNTNTKIMILSSANEIAFKCFTREHGAICIS